MSNMIIKRPDCAIVKSWTFRAVLLAIFPMVTSCMFPWETSYNYGGTYCSIASFEAQGREVALSEKWRERPFDYYDAYFNSCRGFNGSFTAARIAFYKGYESEVGEPPTAFQQPNENSRSYTLEKSFELCKVGGDRSGWDVENACFLPGRDDGPCKATRQSDEKRLTVSCPSSN